MGNATTKPHPRPRNKKHIQFKGADRPAPPGKPYLVAEQDITPDVLTIRWDTPHRNGGAPLSGYLVEHRRLGSPHWVKATPNMVSVAELTLSGLEPGWRYQFRVFAENIVGLSDPSELSEPLTVTLQRSAITAPKFTQELKDTVALENEKVEFVVHFMGQPAPKLCWFKDGFEIFSSRRTRILTENDRSILTIHQSAICDEGEIKCTATNKAGHVSTKARLVLEAPPSIRLPRQYEEGLLFEIGEVIRLKVSVAGLPPPLIFWTHNGESIHENERYEIENSDKTSTLRISDAIRSDRGEYQIKAGNKLGNDVTSFLVTVTDKPSPPGKAKVVMTLGRSVTLSWNTPEDDGGCKVGNYIVEYYRLGWNVWLKAATSRQLTTMLGDLIEGSEYRFRIKAESPFGISEPSEESEVVFIPDPKRGILEPSGRGRSQPRDPLETSMPIAAKRKKPRSQSSSRTEDQEESPGSPIRPERIKVKSPPKTPDHLSPKSERKEVDVAAINKALFDRASISRDLTYGTAEIRIKKTDVPVPKDIPNIEPAKANETAFSDSIRRSTVQVINRQKQHSPSPVKSRSPSPKQKEVSPKNTSPQRDVSPVPGIMDKTAEVAKFGRELSPNVETKRSQLSRENSENLGGSTEFMMVLYPSENNREMGSTSEMGFDLENSISVAPPLSLSAPELGAEPPALLQALRLSASSTELLHERAMVRFYQEALAEEEAIRRKSERDERRASLIPKIQINNQDEEDIVGLERKHSLRRRLSAGGSIPQQVLWAQRRQSLRNSNDFSDVFDTKIHKFPLSIEEKREILQNRQRSHSEEIEEEIFEKVRSRMPQNPNKKSIGVVDEELWDAENYEESLSEEESSEDERYTNNAKIREISPEEEDETYHPRMSFPVEEMKSKYEEPFEILRKPAKLPDANFVPKPILKKRDNENNINYNINKDNESDHSRKSSLEDDKVVNKSGENAPSSPQKNSLQDDRNTNVPKPTNMFNISAIASIAGIAAAGFVISQPILQQRESEEAKVVIEKYGDLVRTCSQKGRKSQLDNNPMREALKQAAALQARLHQSDDEEEHEEEESKKSTDPFSARFQDIEKRIQTHERSATPVFIQKTVVKAPETIIPIFKKKQMENTVYSDEKLDVQIPTQEIQSATIQNKRPEVQKSENKPTENLEENKPMNNLSRGREQTRYGKVKPTVSKSPHPLHTEPKKLPTKPSSRETSSTRPMKKNPNSRSGSISRPESRSGSITRPPSRSTSKPRPRKTSPSPTPHLLRKPKMCEIMTQTSTNVETYNFSHGVQSIVIDEELRNKAEVKVRSTMDYTTDLAMFAVACWVFVFSNELYAVPVLLVAVFRQLNDEVKRRIPNWMKKRWNKKKQT